MTEEAQAFSSFRSSSQQAQASHEQAKAAATIMAKYGRTSCASSPTPAPASRNRRRTTSPTAVPGRWRRSHV